MATLQKHYREKIIPELVKQFGYKSVMEARALPRLLLIWVLVRQLQIKKY